ncbi:ankyrin repeat domain-containing protein [Verrucomicrobiota bacterium]
MRVMFHILLVSFLLVTFGCGRQEESKTHNKTLETPTDKSSTSGDDISSPEKQPATISSQKNDEPKGKGPSPKEWSTAATVLIKESLGSSKLERSDATKGLYFFSVAPFGASLKKGQLMSLGHKEWDYRWTIHSINGTNIVIKKLDAERKYRRGVEEPAFKAMHTDNLRALEKILQQDGFDINKNYANRRGTLLGYAVYWKKDLKTAKLVLKYGADVNFRSAGQLPLEEAIRNPDTSEIAFYLIEHGANIDLVDTSEQPLLLRALHSEKYDLIRFLIERGMDANTKHEGGFLLERVAYKIKPWKNDKDAQELTLWLLEHGANPNATNENGVSVFASVYNNTNLAPMFVEHGANVNVLSYDKNPLLWEAIDDRNIDLVAFLLQNGADPNPKGWSPLCAAIANAGYLKKPDIIQLLFDHGAKDIAPKEGGGTPLMAAIAGLKNDAWVFRIIESSNAQINAIDANGMTPLHYAIFKKRLPVVTNLLAHGADIDLVPSNSVCALEYALRENMSEIASYLVSAGCSLESKQFKEVNPLTWAFNKGDTNFLKVLIKHNYDINQTIQGESPIMWALSMDEPAFGEILVKGGIDLNRADTNGITPLLACFETESHRYLHQNQNALDDDEIKMAEWLVSKGAKLDMKSKVVFEAYRSAVKFGDTGKIRFFVEQGADLNMKYTDMFGTSVPLLHIAVLGEDIPCIKALIKRKVNINAKDPNGNTALDHAMETENQEVIKLLKKHFAKRGKK